MEEKNELLLKKERDKNLANYQKYNQKKKKELLKNNFLIQLKILI